MGDLYPDSPNDSRAIQNVNNLKPKLDELGKEGWELVSYTKSESDSRHLFIFKRKL